jgi:signal transduction histidine kinase
MLSEGSAFLDRSGQVLAADGGFRALLGAGGVDPGEVLRRRGQIEPAVAAFLAGEGPDAIALGERAGVPACVLERVAAPGGLLLRVRLEDAAPVREYVMQAVVLTRLAGTVAHEVKNPLNAMALQLALLGDKIGTASEALSAACAGNLTSLKNQIGRVNEVVRRYLDVADPSPAAGFDAGSLLADAATLFGHEARRRRVGLACEAAPGAARAAGDPARVGRVLLGLLWRALNGVPEGGRLLVRAAPAGAEVVLSIEHARGEPDPTLAWVGPVVAAAAHELGGRLEESSGEDPVRVALVLPKERPL